MVTPLCFLGLTQRQGSKPQQSSSSEHPQPGGLPGALLEVPSTTGCWICHEQSVSFFYQWPCLPLRAVWERCDITIFG